MIRTSLFCLALLVSGAALAAKKEPPSVDTSRPGLAEQRAAVIEEMESGEQFKEISAEDKAQVLAALERMEGVSAGRPVSALSEADKVALINDQELVNALLTKANKDSRIQCKREKKVGSHRTTSTCRTVAEWKRVAQQSREDMEKRRGMGDRLPQENRDGTMGFHGNN